MNLLTMEKRAMLIPPVASICHSYTAPHRVLLKRQRASAPAAHRDRPCETPLRRGTLLDIIC